MNRTHFLKTSLYRGFTLIELLVVIAIIGLLSTIIAGPIQNARNKAKDSKKVADVRNIQNALSLYAEDIGSFPDSLTAMVPNYLDVNLPNFTPVAASLDSYMYVYYDDSAIVHPTTGTMNYGYHLGVKLRVPGNLALDGDSDCTQIGAGGTFCVPQTPGLTGRANVSLYVAGAIGGTTAAGPTVAPGAASDFTAASMPDTSATPCTSGIAGANSCIYDVRGLI